MDCDTTVIAYRENVVPVVDMVFTTMLGLKVEMLPNCPGSAQRRWSPRRSTLPASGGEPFCWNARAARRARSLSY